MATARVTVLTLKGGLARQVLVDYERDTVASLKRQVACLLNGTASDMKLVYRAKPLFDGMMLLRHAGIRGDCTVHVVHRVHGGAAVGMLEVMKQVRSVKKAGLHGVQLVEFDAEDPMVVNIALLGASGSPFHGRQLFLALKFPSDYPHKPPRITFQHPLYHPNVYKNTNKLCWADDDTTGSSYNLEGIIGMVNTLMAKPNPNSPANREAAELYIDSEQAWYNAARAQAKDVLFEV